MIGASNYQILDDTHFTWWVPWQLAIDHQQLVEQAGTAMRVLTRLNKSIGGHADQPCPWILVFNDLELGELDPDDIDWSEGSWGGQQ